jgi:4-oxalocrotonate tautomerase
MPHVIVKLWPGKSEQQKQKLADGLTKPVMSSLGYGEESVSVSLEEVAARDWTEKVYKPDILNGPASSTSGPAIIRAEGLSLFRVGALLLRADRQS